VAASFGVAGALLGHYLTRSWQREQWRIDRRTEEYRELVSALSAVFTNMQRFGGGGGDREFHMKLLQVNVDAFRVIRDRIFIASEIAEADILGRWRKAFDLVDGYQMADWATFANEDQELSKTLVQMALSPPPTFWSRALRKMAHPFKRIGRASRPDSSGIR
jgi:hypothetical protein